MYKDAFSGLPKESWLLSLVEFINRCGSMVLFFMTIYLTRSFHYSPAKAGQVLSAFGLGSIVGSYLGGKLTDVLGSYAVQKWSLILTGGMFILLGQLQSFSLITAAMFFLGVAGEALHPANAAAISIVCPPGLRTKGYALNRLATNLGITFGPFIGGYLALVDYKWLFWVDGITSILAAGVFIFSFKKSGAIVVPKTEKPATRVPVWRDFYFIKIIFFTFCIGLIFVQMLSTFPLYCRTVYNFKENLIGMLISVNTILIAVVEMVLMDKLKTKPVRKVVALGTLLLGLGFALMPLGRGFFYAGFTVVVWTMGEILSMPTLTALIANHADDATRGKYMGLYGFAFSLALFVGPSIGTKVYTVFSPDTPWFCCGVMGILLWIGFYSLKEKTRPGEEVKPTNWTN